jgi:CubicO group peptidase (beta-lactamase class C family)
VTAVHGWVAPGLEPVRDVFVENFAERDELGAAFAVTLGGRPVVDLWGGIADEATGGAWNEDTAQVIFSGTKGLVALCLLMLADRGELELDAPVHRYWPEFASRGKEHVRVLDLASHRARMPGVRTPLSEDDLLDPRRIAELLADQPQDPDVRAADVYHALTYGWLCGELVRRVDGRSIGRFFAQEVAEPLGLRLWIGLPQGHNVDVATVSYAPTWGRVPKWDRQTLATDELLGRVWLNPPLFPPGQPVPFNRDDFRRAEIAAAGAIGTARSVARLYGCLTLGGELDGVRLLSEASLARGRRVAARRWEPLLDEPQAFGVGFQLQTSRRPLGPAVDAFGHGGAGGSMHCAWPSRQVGISYAMNRLRDDASGDPRARALLTTLHESLALMPDRRTPPSSTCPRSPA